MKFPLTRDWYKKKLICNNDNENNRQTYFTLVHIVAFLFCYNYLQVCDRVIS